MSGSQCADFGATTIKGVVVDSNPTSERNFCLAPGGLVFNANGIKAEFAPDAGDQPIFLSLDGSKAVLPSGIDLKANRETSTFEIGNCHQESSGSSKFVVLDAPLVGGKRIPWSGVDQSKLRPLFGSLPERSWLCANREDAGSLMLNVSDSNIVQYRKAFAEIRKNCSGILGSGSEAKCDLLKAAADIYAPEKEQPGFFKEHFHTILGVVLLLAFGTHGFKQYGGDIKMLFRKLFGKKDPPDGPSGGGGGGNNLSLVTIKGVPHLVNNGEVVGQVTELRRAVTSETVGEGNVVGGEINTHGDELTVVTPLPDYVHDWDGTEPTGEWVALPGVVSEDQGAMIYAPQYQAVVDGHFVALLPESGLQSLAGGNYTAAEFLQAARLTLTASALPTDAADLLNDGIAYGNGGSNSQVLSANAFVGGSALPTGGHYDALSQMPGTLTVLESLPATVEGSLLSLEAMTGYFSRLSPAGAR